MDSHNGLKTWVEVDKKAALHNVGVFRSLLKNKTKLYAVVKSNAYGHGIGVFPQLIEEGVDGFCVDSVIEGEYLRKNGITKPILVIGWTHPELLERAKEADIAVMASSKEGLLALKNLENPPDIHLKIDSGMHRQGFHVEHFEQIAESVLDKNLPIKGIFTHFASAKDINYPTYTDNQLALLKKAEKFLVKHGFNDLVVHAAATSGTLIDEKYHLDMVRTGIGLYGLWPSKELLMQLGDKLNLKPVLSWRVNIGEVKQLKQGEFTGYDLTYRAPKDTRIAVLPVGYWHGLDRGLSNKGEVLIKGKRAPIIGMVSMDITVVDVGDVSCETGDTATIIGKDGNEELHAFDIAQKIGTIHYELITRLNPRMKRVVT